MHCTCLIQLLLLMLKAKSKPHDRGPTHFPLWLKVEEKKARSQQKLDQLAQRRKSREEVGSNKTYKTIWSYPLFFRYTTWSNSVLKIIGYQATQTIRFCPTIRVNPKHFVYPKYLRSHKGTFQKRFSRFCPLRGGGYPPLSAKLFWAQWLSVKGG